MPNNTARGEYTSLGDDHCRYKYNDGSNAVYEGQKPRGDGAVYKGKVTYANGDSYEGQFKNHVKHGHGTYTYYGGSGCFQGVYREDKANGYGVDISVRDDGVKRVYKGLWKDDEEHGQGVEYAEDGKTVLRRGMWNQGKFQADEAAAAEAAAQQAQRMDEDEDEEDEDPASEDDVQGANGKKKAEASDEEKDSDSEDEGEQPQPQQQAAAAAARPGLRLDEGAYVYVMGNGERKKVTDLIRMSVVDGQRALGEIQPKTHRIWVQMATCGEDDDLVWSYQQPCLLMTTRRNPEPKRYFMLTKLTWNKYFDDPLGDAFIKQLMGEPSKAFIRPGGRRHGRDPNSAQYDSGIPGDVGSEPQVSVHDRGSLVEGGVHQHPENSLHCLMYALLNASSGDREIHSALQRDESRSPKDRQLERLAFIEVESKVLDKFARHFQFQYTDGDIRGAAGIEWLMGLPDQHDPVVVQIGDHCFAIRNRVIFDSAEKVPLELTLANLRECGDVEDGDPLEVTHMRVLVRVSTRIGGKKKPRHRKRQRIG